MKLWTWAVTCCVVSTVVSAGFYLLMIGAIITDSGDYKYDSIMGTLYTVLALGFLNLVFASRR